MHTQMKEKEWAAIAVLKSAGADVLEAAILARELLTANRGQPQRARQCIEQGVEALRLQEKTVSFEKAVAAALEARKSRRPRTQSDFRYFTRRFLLRCKGLAKRRVRAITPRECAEYIETAFDTARQRMKARLILSGVFGTAIKKGWCSSNPVAKVEVPQVVEQQITILTPPEIESLQNTAGSYQNGTCAAAVGMMLYAGVRPHEVERLTWAQVDLQADAIYIHPRHSKTGGARRISIHQPLKMILLEHQLQDTARICPPDWRKHWRELRRQAGWEGEKRWQQDALRHTFASYYLRHFRSYASLQYEMGHRDSGLLRTRYLDLRGVERTESFWGEPAPASPGIRIGLQG